MSPTYPAPGKGAAVTSVRGLAAICLDSHDPAALALFYATLLGAPYEVDDDGQGASVQLPEGPNIDCLPVLGHKIVKNRVHIDFRAADLDAAVAHAVTLGATLAPDIYEGDRWVVLRDPQGNEFCFLRPRPDGAIRSSLGD
jgi:predicted enzyme related to lactoylglutathione lyase